jgi:hypothetical protein
MSAKVTQKTALPKTKTQQLLREPILAIMVNKSLWIPSAKNPSSGPSLRLSKGNTVIDLPGIPASISGFLYVLYWPGGLAIVLWTTQLSPQ